MKPGQLTPHFWKSEVIASETAERHGIDNSLPPALEPVILQCALELEKVRSLLKTPITPTSWYRCLKLNRVLKSKDSSQHTKGEAVDFKSLQFGTPVEIVKKLATSEVIFDQLILEHSWVHISFAISTGKPRRQVLTLIPGTSTRKSRYVPGITDQKGNPA